MTRAELEEALAQQKTVNAALLVQLALVANNPAATYVPPSLLAYLLEEQHTAIILANSDGNVSWVNKGFTKLCGLEPTEVTGKNPETFLRLSMCDEATVAYIQESLQRHSARRNAPETGRKRPARKQPSPGAGHGRLRRRGLGAEPA